MHLRLKFPAFALVLVGCALGFPAQANAPTGQYTISAGGTVFDNWTKLTWQRMRPTTGGDDSAGSYSWTNAKSYCNSLSLNGMTGWRLPTAAELASIVDDSTQDPAIDLNVFPDQFPSVPGLPGDPRPDSYRTYWAATPLVGGPSPAGSPPATVYCVNFTYGSVGYDYVTTSQGGSTPTTAPSGPPTLHLVRCVR